MEEAVVLVPAEPAGQAEMAGWDWLEFHELANLFPMLPAEELSALAERIAGGGYDEAHPVVLFEGKVLDGRNRLEACRLLRDQGRLAGPPPFRVFAGESALQFVLQENLHRRHLSASQKAAVAVDMLPHFEAEAKRRQVAHLRSGTEIPVSAKLRERENGGKSSVQAAAAVSVSPRYVEEAKAIAEEAPEVFEQVRAGTATLQEAKREVKRRKRPPSKLARAFPEGKYPVVYADPPWPYDFSLDSSDDIENHYQPLSVPDIVDLECEGRSVRDLFAEDCVLFLWATSPKLPEALNVMRAWGFTYKSSIVWHKSGLGMGYWARIDHELLLVGTRGNPGCPPPEARETSVVFSEKLEHSRKPSVFRERIERMFPGALRVELFGRGTAPDGWTFWGNEAESGA